MSTSTSGLHNRYRPLSLQHLIGNVKAVTQLKGLIAKKSFPSAILFLGGPGAGKTTMARALANDLLGGDESLYTQNCVEINFAVNRTIEDVRQVISTARLRPAGGATRRFVLADEVHQLLGNAPAAQAFLKPLEEPVPTTTYLLCSMDAEKFQDSTVGRAIMSRCVKIQLQAASEADLVKQAKRIARGEKMSGYLTPEVLSLLAQNAGGSMREIAMLMEALQAYYNGLDEKPEVLSVQDVDDAIGAGGTANDDLTAARCLTAIYHRKFVAAHKELLNVVDGFGFLNKMVRQSWFLQNMLILKGARHPKVFGNTHAWNLWKELNSTIFSEEGGLTREQQIDLCASVYHALAKLRMSTGAFAVDEMMALSATLWGAIQELKLKFDSK